MMPQVLIAHAIYNSLTMSFKRFLTYQIQLSLVGALNELNGS